MQSYSTKFVDSVIETNHYFHLTRLHLGELEVIVLIFLTWPHQQ